MFPALNGKQACKRKLVAMLTEKYKPSRRTMAAWDVQAKTFDESTMRARGKNRRCEEDMDEYTGLYLDAYSRRERIVPQARREPLLHRRALPARRRSQRQLCRITGKYWRK